MKIRYAAVPLAIMVAVGASSAGSSWASSPVKAPSGSSWAKSPAGSSWAVAPAGRTWAGVNTGTGRVH